MNIKFLKDNLKRISFNQLALIVKKPAFLGLLSVFLAVSVAVYAFLNLDVRVKRGPLLTVLFGSDEMRKQRFAEKQLVQLEAAVLPSNGMVLPAVWGDLGSQLVEAGVIDAEKFEKLYASRGGMSEEDKKLLYGKDNGNLKITQENSGLLLNLLWALGLGNKNEILEKGPMMTYDGKTPASPAGALAKAGQFASTGGWTLARGDTMNHYSMHRFVDLTPEQEELVKRVSQGVYRPCCGNPTHFPDCNHGMAMLGLLELMASQGISEQDMYKSALAVNSFWFPSNYLTIAKYLEAKGFTWDKVGPKAILGANFSSGSGYAQIRSEVEPVKPKSGGGCGV